MERDFMGLSSKNHVAVKEEFVEGGFEDSGFARNSGLPWSLSNKVSGLPQFMPLKYEHDDKSSKNLHGTAIMQPFPGRVQLALGPQSVLPTTASVAGTTEQWMDPMASGAPSQLTIFYGGSVSVFDDITPEKAQAIMFLAGHNISPSYTVRPKGASILPSGDRPPNSGHLSPMSISSHPVDPVNSPATNDNDIQVQKTIGMPATVFNKVEPPKKIPSMRSVAPSATISSAVPQARKASLARFLEKRKERAMNASPYTASKMSANSLHPETKDSPGSSSFSTVKVVAGDV